MYCIKDDKAEKVEPVTFSELKMQESQIEELLRNNIDMLCDEEESMLIVGRQVKDEKCCRSDLTAIDSDGNIVLIEIKRDRQDIVNRKEALEFQAIRYAASYATINSIEDFVKKVYANYIEKYCNEYDQNGLNSYELGIRKLTQFLEANGALNSFNMKQRIILVSSEYDEHTLSAVAWLNSNNVDITCFTLTPIRFKNEIFLDVIKVLPVPTNADYYVNLMERTQIKNKKSGSITRASLPKISDMLEWGVVKPGDVITPVGGRVGEAVLLKNGNVKADEKEMSLQKWLKSIYGWSSVQTYMFAIHKESGKTLSDIRREYMEKQEELAGNHKDE
jgi:hypothetical protein